MSARNPYAFPGAGRSPSRLFLGCRETEGNSPAYFFFLLLRKVFGTECLSDVYAIQPFCNLPSSELGVCGGVWVWGYGEGGSGSRYVGVSGCM